MKEYAIISPGMGIREDMPSILLEKTFTPGDPTLNVIFEKGCIRKAKGRSEEFVPLTDRNDVILLMPFEQTTGIRFFIAGSKAHIYRWDSTEGDWVDITGEADFSGTDTDFWKYTAYGDYLILTNGADNLYKWNGEGDISLVGGSPPSSAKYIANFKNYLVAGNLEDGAHKVAWSAIGEPENWTTGDSGEAVVIDTAPVTGFAQTTDYLIIFKENSVNLMHFVGGDLVFNINRRIQGMGCYAADSISVLNNIVYFFGSNKRLYRFDGIEAHDISEGIQDTLSRIKTENFGLIYGMTLSTLNRIVWLIPEGDVDACNKMLTYDVERGSWFKTDIGGTVMGVGGYELESDETWDTYLARPEITWDNIDPDLRWSDISYATGERVQVIGGADGKIYRMFSTVDDIGATFPGTFVTKKVEFGQANTVRRVLKMQHYFKNEGMDRTITISARIGNNANYETGKEFSLNGGDEDEFMILDHYVDYLGKTLQLKIECDSFFQYMGTIFYYTNIGKR